MKPSLVLVALAAVVACGPAGADQDISKVNGSIEVSPGEHAGNLDTVNGAIPAGANAVVGKADTVNGSITLDSGDRATSLGHATGAATTVNAAMKIVDGAGLGGALTNVNGAIHISAAHVPGQIETTNADIFIGPNARIDGGIHMNADTTWWHFFMFASTPRVVIGPGSVVRGPLHFERAVKLYVSDHASIGPVTGATAIRFAGADPPG